MVMVVWICQGASKHHSRTVNWIMITTKVAVWTTRLNKLGDKPSTNALELFIKRLIGRIKFKYRFVFFNNNVLIFETEWAHGTFFKITNYNKFELLF